jgi:hypothetical protein
MGHGILSPPVHHPYRDKHVWQWLTLCAMGVVALALGVVGFLRTAALHGSEMSPLDALYQSMQLFVLHYDFQSPPEIWQLNAARFLAPMVVSFTTIKAFLTVAFGHHLTIRHQWKHNHVVVCGLGRKGLQLARNYHDQHNWVVVIERDEENPALRQCEDLGIPYWIGDAGDPAVLKKARVQCARLLVAVTGDDGKNIEIALRARELCSGIRSAAHGRLDCFVHVVDPQMRRLLQDNKIFPQADNKFSASMFDFYAECATRLFQAHPLTGQRQIEPDSPTAVRLIVIAFGQMGESVAVRAAGIAKFANGKKLHVTIIDPLAGELAPSFKLRYPDFEKQCDAEIIPAVFESQRVAERIKQILAEPETVVTFAVCCDEDSRSLTVALELKAMLNGREATILNRMASNNGLATLLQGNDNSSSPRQPSGTINRVAGICPFGMLETLATPGEEST